jgi:AcrR family transcriptional regulator
MTRTVRDRADVVPLLTEVFREHGYDGASLALIGRRAGLGKGSLYHFFPGGKEEMARVALAHVSAWFEEEIFRPLETGADAAQAVELMFDAVSAYFHTGPRVCLVGVSALVGGRYMCAPPVAGYFRRWVTALAGALERSGIGKAEALALAGAVVGDFQGAIVLSRALDDTADFQAAIQRLKAACKPLAPARQFY